MTPLAKNPTPWTQKDSTRPVYDANGSVVSFPENAPFIVSRVNAHEALVEALSEYLIMYPAFRSKPMGAPNSEARATQDAQISCEDAALAALSLAEGKDKTAAQEGK